MSGPRRHHPGNAPYYSAAEIAAYLGLPEQTIVARATTENWRAGGVIAGAARRYITLALPRDIRVAMRTGSARRAQELLRPIRIAWWAN
jgi:hypothetical protein